MPDTPVSLPIPAIADADVERWLPEELREGWRCWSYHSQHPLMPMTQGISKIMYILRHLAATRKALHEAREKRNKDVADYMKALQNERRAVKEWQSRYDWRGVGLFEATKLLKSARRALWDHARRAMTKGRPADPRDGDKSDRALIRVERVAKKIDKHLDGSNRPTAALGEEG